MGHELNRINFRNGLRHLFLGFAVFLMIFLVPRMAAATTERDVPWSEMDAVNFDSLFATQAALIAHLDEVPVDHSAVASVIKDPENKISKTFKVPKEIKTQVTFWMRIFSEYSSKQVVILDSNHLDVVYEVVNQRSSEGLESEGLGIRETLRNYRKAFRSLVKNGPSNTPSREEKIILSRTRYFKGHRSYAELQKGLRTIRGMRDSVLEGLVTADVFLPKMEYTFNQLGIPPELTRLSLVESTFNLRAASKVGARGIWQFMLAQGKQYLMIDSKRKIDERLSPLKATLAAGRLLKWNHDYFGNWPLAIVSYNHGLKNLPVLDGGSRGRENLPFSKFAYLFQSDQVRSESQGNYKSKLGWDSRNYYPEFLAMLYAEAYRTVLYGDAPHGLPRSVAFRELEERKTGLLAALQYGVSLQDFLLFNTDIQDLHTLLPKGFRVAIPGSIETTADLFKRDLNQLASSGDLNLLEGLSLKESIHLRPRMAPHRKIARVN